MKLVRKIITLFIVLCLTEACSDHEEVYSAEPKIEFEDIKFEEGPSNSYMDTLTIKFTVADGDKDFGLDVSTPHLEFPYQWAYYYDRSTGLPIPSDKLTRGEIELESLISYQDRLNAPYDTLPEETMCKYDHYNVSDFEYVLLYSTINENYSNLFVDFLYQNPDGSFSTLDFYKEYCTTFNARIPSFSSWPINQNTRIGPFEIITKTSKKGQISYRMVSPFRTLFGSKKIKLRIQIKDRALNASNIVETPEFLLDNI